MAVAAIPAPAALRNSRRFMGLFLLGSRTPIERTQSVRPCAWDQALDLRREAHVAARLSPRGGPRKGTKPRHSRHFPLCACSVRKTGSHFSGTCASLNFHGPELT